MSIKESFLLLILMSAFISGVTAWDVLPSTAPQADVINLIRCTYHILNETNLDLLFDETNEMLVFRFDSPSRSNQKSGWDIFKCAKRYSISVDYCITYAPTAEDLLRERDINSDSDVSIEEDLEIGSILDNWNGSPYFDRLRLRGVEPPHPFTMGLMTKY